MSVGDQWRTNCLCGKPASVDAHAVAGRLRAFGADCVASGDMTPGAKRMLDRIADEIEGSAGSTR